VPAPPDPEAFEACIAAGGVAVFPADTVYGLACDPDSRAAVERLYALKGRPMGKPSAVMFFDVALALAALPELGARTLALMGRLLPGGVTLLQSSANRAGAPDARRLEDVPEDIRRAADLVIDAGCLPGTPSTVVDLRRFEETGEWDVVRAGAVDAEEIRRVL
jgi:L-threonylcarbamoyladenylate synthase